MLPQTGERQVGTELQEILLDHRARYDWVNANTSANLRILDVGCGVGYGANILAECSREVHGIDVDAESINFARKYWARDRVSFEVMDACRVSFAEDMKFDVATVFEVIEHLAAPELMLSALHGVLEDEAVLFVSVPNEEVIAHSIELNPFHIRHYTPASLGSLLKDAGFEIEEFCSQDEADVSPGTQGRTLIARCRRDLSVAAKVEPSDLFVAQGNSAREIVERAKVIRKLQRTIRKSVLRTDHLFESFETSKQRDANYQAEIKSMFDELGLLGQQLQSVRVENERLRGMLAEAEHALVRASHVLAIQNIELKKQSRKLQDGEDKLKESVAKQKIYAANEKALKDRQSQQKKFFNPSNPKIGSLARLTWKYHFFIPILVMAPINTAYGLYKKYFIKTSNISR